MKVSKKTVEAPPWHARGLQGRVVKRRWGLTRADARAAELPDLLKRDFTAQRVSQKRVGDFRADRHVCGIRTGRTIVCWGSGTEGQMRAPEGEFTHIAASGSNSCGIRADEFDNIVCWGRGYGEWALVPMGEFTAIAVGDLHACGVRIDKVVMCWGDSSYGETEAPRGEFTHVAVGNGRHSCGIRTDGTAVCWGRNDSETETDFNQDF